MGFIVKNIQKGNKTVQFTSSKDPKKKVEFIIASKKQLEEDRCNAYSYLIP